MLPSRQLRQTFTMHSCAILLLVFSSLVGALEVSGSNEALPPQKSQLLLQQSTGGKPMVISIEPLTNGAGKDKSAVELGMWRIEGSVKSFSASNMGNVTSNDIALVNCDSSPSTESISQSAVVQTIADKVPKAVILYSFNSTRCDVKDVPAGKFYYYFTIKDIDKGKFATLTAIPMNGIIAPAASSGPQNVPPSNHNQRTPAVAMSILYAVTGIITVLFLAIIATGAYRAHTNPERYGPRTGFAGRPRQSRAKGLARAMLETLPIVKFGDPVPGKPEHEDVELQRTTSSRRPSNPDVAAVGQRKTEVQSTTTSGHNNGEDKSEETVDDDTAKEEQNAQVQGSNVGCSICTEDFEKGEDVRVLPCHHQYHPACIDPWLLNVSGTCPLCRVDLRPVAEARDITANNEGAFTTATGSGGAHAHHNRIQRILATRHAPVHERMATLRQLATEAGREQHSDPNAATSAEEATQRRRLADRLRNVLRIRTRRASASGARTQAPEPRSAPNENNENADMTGAANGAART